MERAHLLLRERREALGLSLDEASGATRIPVRHLEAIEHGRIEQLPEGPWRRGYVLSYAAFLDVEESAVAELLVPEAPPAPELPGGAVRGVALGAAALAILLLGMQLRDWMNRPSAPRAEIPEAALVERASPDQEVALRVLDAGRFRIWVDGESVLDKRLGEGERIEVVGHDRVEVELHTAGAARVVYNGEGIAPQGRQDVGRRLVFIDDVGP
ncbi:MAG: helix-turn-helix domain-containing protein [Proteobacteria bacterium]|nr:helix-turn-helix domain-containing protein [Pseudomonadota bacterium]